MAKLSSSGVVTAEVCLAITLLILSGVPCRLFVLIFGVAESTAYEVFHRTLDVLADVQELSGIPTTEGELAVGFKNSRSPPGPLNGCIGAIDGISIRNQDYQAA